MIEEEKRVCVCEIKGKRFDANDKTCIKCRASKKILDKMFEIAVKKAIEDGNMSLLEMFIENL